MFYLWFIDNFIDSLRTAQDVLNVTIVLCCVYCFCSDDDGVAVDQNQVKESSKTATDRKAPVSSPRIMWFSLEYTYTIQNRYA